MTKKVNPVRVLKAGYSWRKYWGSLCKDNCAKIGQIYIIEN
jgi:hypothetical protein